MAQDTSKVLKTLTPREEKVLRLRLGIPITKDEEDVRIGTGDVYYKGDHTLDEIALQLDTTRERIRQIEAK